MGNFFIKLFIKNHKDTKDPQVREAFGKFAGTIGILSNLLLCTMKILVGVFSASIAIIADGINNLSDASSSVITLIGFKLAAQPEDKTHPYGHARIEYLAGLFVSIIIIFVGIFLLKSSVVKIIDPETLSFSLTTIIVLSIAIIIKLWQAYFYSRIGKRINSLTLKATATDSRNDVIATIVVLVGVIITKFTGLQLDGYLGCAVALFIIWSGIELIKETSSPLLGEAPDEELVIQISQMALSYDGVLGIHDLVVHNYGPGKIFASLHVEVDADGDFMECHDIIDNIERKINNDLKIYCVIHMDPVKINDPIIDEIRPTLLNCIRNLDGIAEMHDLRAVPGTTHTNIIFDLVMSNDCKKTEDEITEYIQACIQVKHPTYFVVITFDKSYTSL